MGMDEPECRDFEAWIARRDDGLELRVTGEVRGPGLAPPVSLRPHEVQGFNELDLLVGLIAERVGPRAGDRSTWVPVTFTMPTRTPYTTVTITDCGATITVIYDPGTV